MKRQTKITSTMLICLVIVCALFFSLLMSGNTNYKHDENSEKFSRDLKMSGLGWTTTEVVSTESTSTSSSPTIAVDGDGNAHVAWEDYTNYSGQDIFYKRWNVTSSTWTTTEVVSTEYTSTSSSPTIAVDGAGNVHVAWEDYTDYYDREIFYKRWNVTSSTWTTTEVVSTEYTSTSSSPTIAVDGDGNAHVAWHDDSSNFGPGIGWNILYKRWNATSNTWTTTEAVFTESIGSSSSPTIAVDGAGNAHVAWEDYASYGGSGTDRDIFYKRWNATSNTWTTTEVASTESTSGSYSPTIAVDGAGNAHVAWYDYTDYGGSGTDVDIFYKRWDATSNTWTTTEVVSTESTDDSRNPSIAVDGAGNAHVAWYDYTDYGGSGTDVDILYKRWNTTHEIIINAPIFTSTWQMGNSYDILWNSAGNFANVEIELYWKETFNATISASTPNDGSYSWTIPSGFVNSSQYQIKITDVSNSSFYDYSDYFEIFTPPTPVDSGSSSPEIPGYDLIFLIGISSVITLFLIKKQLMEK